MKENLYCAALLLIVIPTVVLSQGLGWKTIRPAESTIVDVERIFGEPQAKDHYMRYERDDGVYFISFSNGVCTTKWKKEWNSEIGGLPPLKEGTPLTDWNLPEWTVEKVYYLPSEGISISSLNIDLAKLRKTAESPHTPDIFTYTDATEGISYEVQYEYKQSGKRVRKIPMVSGITLLPATRYSNRLCQPSKTKLT
ncbi:MAG: hypothetical protein ABIR33_07740 [Pyrinomonadaceae bacterium]